MDDCLANNEPLTLQDCSSSVYISTHCPWTSLTHILLNAVLNRTNSTSFVNLIRQHGPHPTPEQEVRCPK
jgi:hypothetical protein